jgi:hypothetical protein
LTVFFENINHNDGKGAFTMTLFEMTVTDCPRFHVPHCTTALILFIHLGFLEYLSFKQFKLIVKMTRIESGVTIPKGLFTFYLNVKKVTAKIFWPP